MLERVREAEGETFRPVEAYRDDLSGQWARIDRFDKLERLQHFRQPEDASWRAFAAGRWEESLELTERNRPVVEAEFARLGFTVYRVRVVELPITPYVQWEMHRFTIRVNCGENIRVAGPEAVSQFESNSLTPELIFTGDLAMYEVLYDETGVLAGGRKFTDPDLIATCRAEVQALYAQSEDFRAFFDREIATLPPPIVDPELSPSTGS